MFYVDSFWNSSSCLLVKSHKPKSLSSDKVLQLWDTSSDGLPSWDSRKTLPLNLQKQGQCLGKQETSLDAVFLLICIKTKASIFSAKCRDLNKSAFSNRNCSISSFTDVLICMYI